MPRSARLIIPGVPHHITQRGNRRSVIFFEDDDYRAYLARLSERCQEAKAGLWAYCLMPNHVHLLFVPMDENSFRAVLAETHRWYARRVNLRQKWSGHLWQDRFTSLPVDGPHLYNIVRYIEMNPVRAGLVSEPGLYPWSSARAHLLGIDDPVLTKNALADMTSNWAEYLKGEEGAV